MKISIFRLAQWLGWACCLAMTWMAQALYHKGDPMDGIFFDSDPSAPAQII